MRKRRRCPAALLLAPLLALLLFFPLTASAAEDKGALDGYIDDFADSLPSEIGEAIREDKLAEMTDMGHLLTYLFGEADEGMESLRGTFLTLVGLVLLLSLASLLAPPGANGALAEKGIVLLAALLLFRGLSGTAEAVSAYLDDLSGIATALTPVMCALQTAGGNTLGAALAGNAMAWFFTLLENLVAGVLHPLVEVCFGFVAVSALGDDMPVGGLFRGVRSLYLLLLGFFSTLLTASLSLQKGLASAGDSFAFKTARYALGNLLPLVGGTVSGSLGTVAASVTLLRQTVGVGAVVSILYCLLPLLLELFLLRTMLSLAKGASEMTGAVRAHRLFGDVCAIYDMLLAVVALPSLLFFFIATLFARSATAL